jgi:hypothetical protein
MLDLDKKIASIRSEDEEVDAKVDIRKQRDEGSGRLQEPCGCGILMLTGHVIFLPDISEYP